VKVRITIAGEKVHDIGYRYYLMENALAFGIERFRAVNLVKDKQIVEVFVEGEEENVKEFCEFVRTNFPPDAVVDEVKVEDYKGHVPKIEAFALVFNIGQARKFIEEAKGVKSSLNDINEKLTDVKNTIKEESEKTRQHLAGVIREESEKTRTYLGDKIDALRLDLKTYLDEKLKKLEEEIKAIKAKIGMA